VFECYEKNVCCGLAPPPEDEQLGKFAEALEVEPEELVRGAGGE
jgi:hypothetical protein